MANVKSHYYDAQKIQIIYDFLLTSQYYDARKIEKNMYFRLRQSKLTLVWCPKNTENVRFFVKITQLWCPKILKKTCISDVAKAKSHFMIPKKYRLIYNSPHKKNLSAISYMNAHIYSKIQNIMKYLREIRFSMILFDFYI